MLALLLGVGAALAGDGPYHLDLHVETRLPSHVGGRVAAEFPGRVRLAVGAGVLPGPYVDLVNAVVVAFNGYDERTAEVVKSSIQSSLAVQVEAGWRPLKRYGLVFDVGYQLLTLGGNATSADVLYAASGVDVPDTGDGRSFDASSTLHQISVQVGWEEVIAGRVVIGGTLGGLFTVGAHSTVEPAFDPLIAEPWERAGDEAAAWLDETYLQYVHTPTVTLRVGYRFF